MKWSMIPCAFSCMVLIVQFGSPQGFWVYFAVCMAILGWEMQKMEDGK